jgi:hypothetical protein
MRPFQPVASYLFDSRTENRAAVTPTPGQLKAVFAETVPVDNITYMGK